MKILAFGEILYDIFDTEAKIGGAPLNFCAHFSKLGGGSYILSAVGQDTLGSQAVKTIEKLGVATKYIQQVPFTTGVCQVTYTNGEPNYELKTDVAYDNIAVNEAILKEIEKDNFDIFYFGTLAQRNSVSKQALKQLLSNKPFKKVFFDINLRQSYYSYELLEYSLKYADIVKINRFEFEKLKALGFCTDENSLCQKFNIEKLLITLDKDGIMLYDGLENCRYYTEKPKNEVVSTVGAGDASSACFLYYYLLNEPLQKCIDKANIMGDYIVTFKEAIPDYSNELSAALKK